MNFRPRHWLAWLVLSLPALARAEEPFYLKDGDRVVFYGDSITDQRLYTTFVETYVVTRFPKMQVSFTHSGWGGDRVGGGGGGPIDLRLKRDVFAYKPTVMTIMLGMNDASYQPFKESIFSTYIKGMESIVSKVKAAYPDIRVTLIKPSPFDDVTRPPAYEGGYNGVLVRYGEALKDLADKAHVDTADLNTSVVAATRKANEIDPKLAPQLNPDRVHPGPGGQLLMAAALLKDWHAPALVSQVALTVDGEKAKSQAENTSVDDLTLKDRTLTWSQCDRALPFFINLGDKPTALAVAASDIVSQLDQETLKVEGLPGEEYTLAIDGKDVGHFSRAKLAEGVNLALLDTPMLQQAKKVHDLTLEHNNLHFTRWRSIQVPLAAANPAHLAKAIEALDAIEADVIADQRAAARPKSHKYSLQPRS